MTISKNVINDLLPLYFSNECSTDTKQLIENYLKSNPDFEKEIKQFSRNPLPNTLPQTLEEEIEMNSLKKTRKLLRMRSYLMGFAIFFSLVPFSFRFTDGNFYWLLLEVPGGGSIAFLAGALGLGLWIGYFSTYRNIKDM